MIFRFAPGYTLPSVVFSLLMSAVVLMASSLVISRRRAAYVLLIAVFLIGCWRGSYAISDLEQADSQLASASQAATFIDASPIVAFGPIRQNIGNVLNQTIGQSDAGLSIALLTGDRSYLRSDMVDNFRSAGMAHLLAISGLHVGLLGGLAMAVSILAFGRRHSTYLFLPLVMVLAYAALAGFAPPVTRAAIMFSVFIVGRVLGRGSHTLAALALAAMLMVALDPAILASLSFQLSFAAMLGIAFASPVLEGLTEITTSRPLTAERSELFDRIRRFVVGSLAVSIAASIGTLPLVALHFDAVPIWSPVSTLLAVPALPILVSSSVAVLAVANVPIPILPDIIAFSVKTATEYLAFIADLFANLPPKPIQTGAWSVWMTVLYYAAIVIAVLQSSRLRNFRYRLKSSRHSTVDRIQTSLSNNIGLATTLSAVFLVLAAAMWSIALSRSTQEQNLSVRFLQTSHGESIFIETPNRTRMLIDGGADASQMADTLAEILPFWDREIDIVLLTHPDADHLGGLPEVLRRFSVDTVLHSGQDASSDSFTAWADAVEAHENAIVAWTGMQIALDSNVTIEVLSSGCADAVLQCSNTNDASIVTMLRHGSVTFLFTGDIERSAEVRLAASIPDLRATVFKAPHHGSNTSSSATLVNAVEPAAVVVAAGTDNPYGHPHPEVINRFNELVGDDRVFRTDQLGTVELQTNGDRLWMIR